MKSILEVTDLNKSYGGFSLENVNFSLPEDCITGFIGVNGAGKTTTIRSIMQLTPHTSGTIKVFGLDMEKHERELKNRIGIVLDDGGFYDELTLMEMKKVIAPAYSTWSEADFKRYMDRFALHPKQKINTLSKGMRMKYALALALSHQAELLIMDEPTSGLDPLIRSQLLTILTDYMSEGGKGVFFSTHITSDLEKVADMLIMIDHGRIVFQEEKNQLLERYRLVKGDVNALNAENRKLFQSLHTTAYGFTGITDQVAKVQHDLPGTVMERPNIEDIMLGYIEGGKEYAAAID
jgi:ABC-2 type transport system ATP-binding protein